MASELSKIGLPRVDKLCDAKWVKTVFNTSKKEFAQFVERTSEMKDYMRGVENRISDSHEEFRDLIRKYLDRVTIKEKADQFKSDLKEAERERRRLKKKEESEARKNDREKMKEELRKELLAEMDDEKEKTVLEKKAGVVPKKKMMFRKNDIRNRTDDESSLQTAFEESRDVSMIPNKKVVFGNSKGAGASDGAGASAGGMDRKMDLATLSAFISKSAAVGRLGVCDEHEQELPFVQCDVVKDKIQLQVQIDVEALLGSMIREGRFKLIHNGNDLTVSEMSIGARGKVELTVE